MVHITRLHFIQYHAHLIKIIYSSSVVCLNTSDIAISITNMCTNKRTIIIIKELVNNITVII